MSYYYNLLLHYGLPVGVLLSALGALFYAFVGRAIGAAVILAGLGLIAASYIY